MADAAPVDRISNLPEPLISDILSSLPTKEAVATSILSRSWRFRWTEVTSFHFNNSGESSKNQIREDDGVETMDFAEFIDMVLLKHNGDSINKFVLVWESSNFRPVLLNSWANIAIARNVRVLNLKTVSTDHPSVSSAQCEFQLPSPLYTSGTLEVLKLEGPFRIKPPNVVCLPKLVLMDFTAVIYETDESVPILLSGCPALYLLTIERRNKRDNLVVCIISSPVLKHLIIQFHDENQGALSGGGDDLKLKLKIDAPALEVLYLCDNMCRHISIEPSSVKEVNFDPPYSSQNIIDELLQALASVKFLTLHFDAMVAIDRAMELAELEALMTRAATEVEVDYDSAARATLPSFERLAKLFILRPHWARWSTLMHLVDGCVRLEELAIWWIESGGHIWRDPARVPRCLLSSLKHLTLAGFDGGKEKMLMLKYFLENGLVMERVAICCKMQGTRLEILNKVSQLPKASPACKISCLDYSETRNYFLALED